MINKKLKPNLFHEEKSDIRYNCANEILNKLPKVFFFVVSIKLKRSKTSEQLLPRDQTMNETYQLKNVGFMRN